MQARVTRAHSQAPLHSAPPFGEIIGLVDYSRKRAPYLTALFRCGTLVHGQGAKQFSSSSG
eukprot:6472644-Amphidinium_carterae.1